MQLSSFPTHNEMADYLEAYAQRFNLPVRSGVRATRVSRSGNGFRVETSHGVLQCDRVVIATGGYNRPVVPAFATELAPGIRQLHSSAYRNPKQLEGTVLVVGAGNSGAEIALDAVRSGHQTWLSGTSSGPGAVPHRDPQGEAAGADRDVRIPPGAEPRHAAGTEVRAPSDRARHPACPHQAERPRGCRCATGRPYRRRARRTARSRSRVIVLEPQTVVWCTGYRPDYSWIDLPVADADGHPITERGVSPETGLYFIGVEFQYAAASSTIQGLGSGCPLPDACHGQATQPSSQCRLTEPAAA